MCPSPSSTPFPSPFPPYPSKLLNYSFMSIDYVPLRCITSQCILKLIPVHRDIFCSFFVALQYSIWGFPGGFSGEEPARQCRRPKRPGFNPWVGKIPWRREWLPTPIVLPGESHGQSNLVGCGPQGCKESDVTEAAQPTYTNRVLHFIDIAEFTQPIYNLAFKGFSFNTGPQ